MDIEQKQTEFIDHFVKQASSLKGSALGSVVTDATSHPSLFAFSEILAVPSVVEVCSTDYSFFFPLNFLIARFILRMLLLGFFFVRCNS